jgi:hypothetical protein
MLEGIWRCYREPGAAEADLLSLKSSRSLRREQRRYPERLEAVALFESGRSEALKTLAAEILPSSRTCPSCRAVYDRS